jgi:hypothetical protein
MEVYSFLVVRVEDCKSKFIKEFKLLLHRAEK